MAWLPIPSSSRKTSARKLPKTRDCGAKLWAKVDEDLFPECPMGSTSVCRPGSPLGYFTHCSDRDPTEAERDLGYPDLSVVELSNRELASLNLAINGKSRGCELVGLRVHDLVQRSHVWGVDRGASSWIYCTLEQLSSSPAMQCDLAHFALLIQQQARRSPASSGVFGDPRWAAQAFIDAAPVVAEAQLLARLLEALRRGAGAFREAEVYALGPKALEVASALVEAAMLGWGKQA